MKTVTCLVIALGILASPVLSFAQNTAPLARAEVRAEVRAGLFRVETVSYNPAAGDDANYPADIQATDAGMVMDSHHETTNDGIGGMPVSGNAAAGILIHAPERMAPSCVGPVSDCDIYSGS